MKIQHFYLALEIARIEDIFQITSQQLPGERVNPFAGLVHTSLHELTATILQREDRELILDALPAARGYVECQLERRRALQATRLGELVEALFVLSTVIKAGISFDQEMLTRRLCWDDLGALAWEKFLKAVNNTEQCQMIVDAMRGLLDSIIADLTSVDFPPPPSKPDFED